MAGQSIGTIKGTIKIDYDGAGVARANRDVASVGKSGEAAGQKWDKASKLMLVGGLAIAGGFAVAVNSAANFDKSLSDIQAVSGATGQQMDAVRKKALQLGADTQFSAGEAADAIGELSKAGVSLPDILNGAADATVALAAAGGVALPEAATIASNAMNQFALSARDLPRVADLIAGAANASAIDVKQFGFSLAQVGAVAKLAGVSFDDTAVAIAELGNAGIVGSDAGTSLKTFLQNLIPTTKQQIELSKQLGLITKDGGNAFFDASGKVKSLAEVSQVLQNALKGLSKEQQLNALQTLFGSDAIRAASVLSDQGASGFNKLADAMSKVKAADVAKTKMDNLKGSIEQLKGSLETAGITIGEILIPPIKKLIDNFTRWVNAFQQLNPSTQRTILIVLGIVSAILIFVGVTYKIIQVIKVFQVVWAALNIEFLFSPIGLIIIAIVALVAAIVLIATKTHWFQDIWHATWNLLKTIGAWFAGPFANFFITRWNTIWGFFKTVGAWFAGPFANFFVSLWNIITTVFNAVKNVVMTVVNAIVASFRFWWSVVSGIINFFVPLFRAVFGLVTSIVKLAWSIITAIIQVAVTIINAVITLWLNTFVAFWKFIWGVVWGTIQAVWSLIGPYVIGTINAIQSGIATAVNGIVTAWNATWNFVSSVITAVWGYIGPYVIGTVNAIQSGISIFIGWIKTFFVGGFNLAKDQITIAWNALVSFFTTLWNGVVAIFTFARDRVIAIINGVRAIVDNIRKFFDELKNAASGGVGSLIAFVAGIPGRILNAIGNLGSALYNKGRDLIQGFINGIAGMAGRIRNALVGLLPGPLKQFAGMLGLASPSKLFKQWGVFTIQGFINGLASMQSQLTDAMATVGAVTTSGVSVGTSAGTGASPGLSGASATPSVTVHARPQVVVVADLGDGVRHVVKSTIVDEPDLVSASAAKGDQTRGFVAPGR